jgi:hypothetical protein
VIQLGPDPGLVSTPTALLTQVRYFQCPASYTFSAWQMACAGSATVSVDIRKHTFPSLPGPGDSMTNSHPLTITAAQSNTGSY